MRIKKTPLARGLEWMFLIRSDTFLDILKTLAHFF